MDDFPQTEREMIEAAETHMEPPDEPHPRFDEDDDDEFVPPNDEFGLGLGEIDGGGE